MTLAINGRGWFQIAGPNGETLYTRAGAFNLNENRQLVTPDGYLVTPAIIVPQNAVDVTVNEVQPGLREGRRDRCACSARATLARELLQ